MGTKLLSLSLALCLLCGTALAEDVSAPVPEAPVPPAAMEAVPAAPETAAVQSTPEPAAQPPQETRQAVPAQDASDARAATETPAGNSSENAPAPVSAAPESAAADMASADSAVPESPANTAVSAEEPAQDSAGAPASGSGASSDEVTEESAAQPSSGEADGADPADGPASGAPSGDAPAEGTDVPPTPAVPETPAAPQSAAPAAEPAPVSAKALTLSGAEEKNGTCRYPWVASASLRFDWPKADADSYGFALYQNNQPVWTKVTKGTSVTVPCAELPAGSWVAGVAAYRNGAAVATWKLDFTLYVPGASAASENGSSSLKLSVTVLGAQNAQITYTAGGLVSFTWTDVGAKLYSLTVNEGSQTCALLYTEGTSAEVSFDDMEPAAYTAVVCASLPDGQVIAGTTAFLVAEARQGQKDGQDGADGKSEAANQSKRKVKNLKNAKKSTEPTGFSVTPGKALTSTHSAGTKDMQLYGTVELRVDRWQSDRLSMGGEELDVTCGGAYFGATLRQGVLTLKSESDDWAITQAALKTLNRSGVTDIVVTDGGSSLTLPTGTEMTGTVYAGLRAQGCASSDFVFGVTDGAWTVQVDGRTYSLEDGVLAEMEQ